MTLPGLLAFFLALAPLVVLPSANDFANLPQSAFVQVGVLALLLAAWSRPRPVAGPAPFDRPLLLLGLWSLASLGWAHNRYEGGEVLLHWAACGVMYVLVSREVRGTGERQTLLRGLLAGGVLVALVGLGQQTGGLAFVPQVGPPAGTLANRNVAAELMVMALPAALVSFVAARSARRAAPHAAAAALVTGYLFHTRTRGAWVAAALEVVVVGLLARRLAGGRPGREKVLLGLGAGALGLFIAALTPEGLRWPGAEVGRLLAETGRGAAPDAKAGDGEPPKVRSVGIRLTVWRAVGRMVRDHPLAGVGLGNLRVHYPAYSPEVMVEPVLMRPLLVDQAHNEYLQAAAELGLVGLGLLGWLGALGAGRAWRAAEEARSDPVAAAPAVAAAVGLLGLAVSAAFAFPLHRAIPPLVAAAFLGILGAAPAAAPAAPRGRVLRLAAAAAALVLVVAWSERRLRADRHVRAVGDARAGSDWERVVAEGTAAARANPLRSAVLLPVGIAHLQQGQAARAAAVLSRVAEDYPYDRSALGNLGVARLRSGDLVGARAALERVLALHPGDALARFHLAAVHEEGGCLARAREELEAAVAADPAEPLYREALARLPAAGEAACPDPAGEPPPPGIH